MLNKILVKAIRLLNDVNQKKAISFVVMRGLSVISNYIFSLLLIKLFSSKDYGIFVEALSILMILSVLLKFGIDVHFVKIFSDFKSIGVPRWIQKLERKVFYISIIIALLLIIIFWNVCMF